MPHLHRVILLVLFVALELAALDGFGSWHLVPSATPAPASLPAGFLAAATATEVLLIGGRDGAGAPLDQVQVWRAGHGWWTGRLSAPMVDGAVVADAAAVYVVGGRNAAGATAAVVRLSWQGDRLREDALPALPGPRTRAGVGILDRHLVVVGGTGTGADGLAPQFLHLDRPDAWQPVPGAMLGARLDPVVGTAFGALLVAGGRDMDSGLVLRDAAQFRFKPIDGKAAMGWLPVAEAPAGLAGGSFAALGQSQLVAWTLDGRPQYCHLVTGTWVTGGESVSGLSGTTLLPMAGKSLVLGGTADGNLAALAYQPVTQRLGGIDTGIILVYLFGMAVVGVICARRQKTTSDFAMGGRKVHWFLAGISLYATHTSAISLMAMPAQAYAGSLVYLAVATMVMLTTIPVAYVVVPLLRRLEIVSTYEYLERRFDSRLRLLGSLQCIIFQTCGRMSVVMLLPALAISTITGWNIIGCILLMGVLSTLFTTAGGLAAVIWTDLFQGLLMLLGPIAAVVLVCMHADGGASAVVDVAQGAGKLQLMLLDADLTRPVIWIFIFSSLMQIVGFAGDQTMVQRVICTPSVAQATKATVLSNCVGLIGAIFFQIMGVAMFAHFQLHPGELAPELRNDQIVPWFIVGVMPVGLAGLFIAAIFGASMATLSGSVNSVATLVSEDFDRRLRPQATDRQRLFVMRVASLVTGLVGICLAIVFSQINTASMWELWNIVIALIGGGFVGIYTLGMFTTRCNSFGAMAGAIISIPVTLMVMEYTSVHWLMYTPCSILSCVLLGYALSRFFGAPTTSLAGLTIYTMTSPGVPVSGQGDGPALLGEGKSPGR